MYTWDSPMLPLESGTSLPLWLMGTNTAVQPLCTLIEGIDTGDFFKFKKGTKISLILFTSYQIDSCLGI